MKLEEAKSLAGRWVRQQPRYSKYGRIWKYSHCHRGKDYWYLIAHVYCALEIDIIVWDDGKVEHA